MTQRKNNATIIHEETFLKMSKETILNKLKTLFEKLEKQGFADVPATANPTDGIAEYSLKDGTKIMANGLDVGSACTNADGTPLAVGDYELADGTKITVAEGGLISAITPNPATAVLEPAIEEMAKQVKQLCMDAIAQFNEQKQSFETSKSAMQTEIDNLKSAMAAQTQAFKEVTTLLKDAMNFSQTDITEKPKERKLSALEEKQIKFISSLK